MCYSFNNHLLSPPCCRQTCVNQVEISKQPFDGAMWNMTQSQLPLHMIHNGEAEAFKAMNVLKKWNQVFSSVTWSV